jgi:hypothetical protein
MELNPKFQIVSKVPHKLAKVATFVSVVDKRVDVGEGYCV